MKLSALVKRYAAEKVVEQGLRILAGDPERSLLRLTSLAKRVVFDADQRDELERIRNFIIRAFRHNHPAVSLITRVLSDTNPHCRNRIAVNFLVNAAWLGKQRRLEIERDEGIHVPFTFLISPTMRCNLRCSGCYAGEYSKADDLDIEVIDRVISEGKDLGIYFVTVLGGEPLVRDDMFEIYRKHSDVVFQVFTNGTLIGKGEADILSRLGNVIVVFSVDGREDSHDMRRGRGNFKKVAHAMACLRKVGVPFGFSTMITRKNLEEVIGKDFVDYLVDQGCYFGWHFLYIPVGREADVDLMATPEQREHLRTRGARYIRQTKPIGIIDFWNDAPLVGGCIAGGKDYFHVNSKGDVEPCIFAHFAVDNIKQKSIKKVLSSPLFKAIQSRQPYNHNLLRPCMLIDSPHVFRDVVAETGAYPTHQGAEAILHKLSGDLDDYAAQYAKISDEVWNCGHNSSEPCL